MPHELGPPTPCGGSSSAWERVGCRSDCAEAYVDRVNADPEVAALRARAHNRVEPVAGRRIVDVGCGPGTDARELVERDACIVVAVDHDAEMVTRAAAHPGVVGVVADARALPFRSAAMHVARAVRVLMHLPDPERAVEELVRVTSPGGRVLVSEPDWAGFTLDPAPEGAVDALRRVYGRRIRHPYAGRSLVRWLVAAGCEAVAAEVSTVVLRSADRIRADFGLDEALREAWEQGDLDAPVAPWDPGTLPVVAWNPSVTAVGIRGVEPR